MKRFFLGFPQYKWILVMLVLAALLIGVFIYYNRRIKSIDDKLKRMSFVKR